MADINWRHFFLFVIIEILIFVIIYWIFKDANLHTKEMYYANLLEVIRFPIIVAIMIYTHKGRKRLNFAKKMMLLIGLIISSFVLTFLINYINIFNRQITPNDIIIGVRQALIFYCIMLIICLPIIGFIKTKVKNVS